MNCPLETHHPDLLVSYAAGELSRETVLDLEQHLASCPACHTLAEQQRTVWKALDAWEVPPVSTDFDRRLYRRIEQATPFSWWERLTRSFRPMPVRQAIPLAVTAGLLLIAGLLIERPAAFVPAAPASPAVRADQVESTLDDLDLLRQFPSANSAESAHPDAM